MRLDLFFAGSAFVWLIVALGIEDRGSDEQRNALLITICMLLIMLYLK
jgi:hypothetical protein